jgi:hypothetical protein
MRKAAHNRLGKKQTVKDVMIMNSFGSNPGLQLANAFSVSSDFLEQTLTPKAFACGVNAEPWAEISERLRH